MNQEFQLSLVAPFHYYAAQSCPAVALLSEIIYGTALKTQSMKTAELKKIKVLPKKDFFFLNPNILMLNVNLCSPTFPVQTFYIF